jgi:hypothetical protein
VAVQANASLFEHKWVNFHIYELILDLEENIYSEQDFHQLIMMQKILAMAKEQGKFRLS